MVTLTEVLDNIDVLAGSDLLVRWSLGEPQNKLPTGKETSLPSLYQEKLESCDLPIIFATTFRFLILGERQTLKSSTLSKATSSLCSESSSESILLRFGSLLDSITGLDTRFSAGIGGAMVETDIYLTLRLYVITFNRNILV